MGHKAALQKSNNAWRMCWAVSVFLCLSVLCVFECGCVVVGVVVAVVGILSRTNGPRVELRGLVSALVVF